MSALFGSATCSLSATFVDKISRMKGGYRPSPRYPSTNDAELQPLPLLRDVTGGKEEALLIRKLRQSSVVFDFTDPVAATRGLKTKLSILNELVDYVTEGRGRLTEAVYPEIIRMISANLFLTLPPGGKNPEINLDESCLSLEASRTHRQLVYELFQRLLEAPDLHPAFAEAVTDKKFIVQLLELFDSEHQWERYRLASITHRIYKKFLGLRQFIRKQINDILLTFVYETEHFNGVGELLEILKAIISGFSLPLKEVHKTFLIKVLIPLHTPKSLGLYHEQLVDCVVTILKKDATLTERVVNGLVKFWPKTCTRKELMFLDEIEEILEHIQPTQFTKIQEPLFRQIAKCVCSPQFQVSERALYLWNNDYILCLIEENNQVVMKLMFPALYRICMEHWNQTIEAQVYSVLEAFVEMNSELFDELTSACKTERQRDKKREKESDELWKRLSHLELDYMSQTSGNATAGSGGRAGSNAALSSSSSTPGTSLPTNSGN